MSNKVTNGLFKNKLGIYYTYIGQIENGKPNGQGIGLFMGVFKGNDMNGCQYTGEWKDGTEHGFGILIKENSDFKLEGEFKGGVSHGYAVRVGKHGDRYEGEWKNGHHHGKGIYHGTYGEIFEGEFRNNKFFTGIKKSFKINGNSYPDKFEIIQHKIKIEKTVLLMVLNKLSEENKLQLGTKEDICELLCSIGYNKN